MLKRKHFPASLTDCVMTAAAAIFLCFVYLQVDSASTREIFQAFTFINQMSFLFICSETP